MATQTLNHTLLSRGSRVLLSCYIAPKMRLCECFFAFNLFHSVIHFQMSALIFITLPDLTPQQIYFRRSSVVGPDRSRLHLDCVQSHDWKPRLHPRGIQTHLQYQVDISECFDKIRSGSRVLQVICYLSNIFFSNLFFTGYMKYRIKKIV